MTDLLHNSGESPVADVVLILWRPLLPYGYSYKASCARPG